MKNLIFSLILIILIYPQSLSAQESPAIESVRSVRSQLKNELAQAANTLKEYRTARGERNPERMKERLRTHTGMMITVRLRAIALQKERLRKRCGKLPQHGEVLNWLTLVESNLKSLQNDLNLASDLEAIKTITRRIINENHVFVGLLPSVNGACSSALLISRIDLVTKSLPTLKEQGYDTSALEQYLANAKTDASNAYSLFKAVASNLSDSPEVIRGKLNDALEKLKNARENLAKAKDELEKIRASKLSTPTAGVNYPID